MLNMKLLSTSFSSEPPIRLFFDTRSNNLARPISQPREQKRETKEAAQLQTVIHGGYVVILQLTHRIGPTAATEFHTLHAHFTLHPSAHTSTHIHLSSTPHPLPASALASLAKSAVYHEPALDSPALRGLSLGACLALLDGGGASGSTKALVEAVTLFPASSAYGRAHGKRKDFVRSKMYKWDFTGMVAG
ncbi:hypothetical protein B0T18DRAFT_430114 [Schizothecium vesticola]|uniref:Uncharacterized protein n=1 Tax=Schizothecium vesticola TaxID=314040 RepID=A0AA40ENP8_9PEZI|nr:hypothetical protein B0T18DRAFT_430114 [Schizothecium vesticola]